MEEDVIIDAEVKQDPPASFRRLVQMYPEEFVNEWERRRAPFCYLKEDFCLFLRRLGVSKNKDSNDGKRLMPEDANGKVVCQPI